jgi:competence protein ComEC
MSISQKFDYNCPVDIIGLMKNSYFFIFAASISALFLSQEIIVNIPLLKLLLLLGILSTIATFLFKKFRLCFIIVISSFALLFTIYFQDVKAQHIRVSSSIPGQNFYINLEGTILEYPIFKEDSTIIYLRTDSQNYNKQHFQKKFTVRIKIKGHLKEYYRGDRIEINSKLYKPDYFQNFNPPAMKNYSLYRRYHFNGYCKSPLLVNKLQSTGLFFKLIGKWRDIIRRRIKNYYFKTKILRQGVFLEAIILGDRGKLSNDLKESLLSSGIYHLLAISGAHIGIITIFFLLFLKLFRINYRTRYMLTAILLILFLFISGFHISAFRAVLMAEFFILGKLLYLKSSPFNIISLCGLIILFINPAQFLDPGFILTFSLTLSIVTGREYFLSKFRQLYSPVREFISANLSVSIISIPLSLQFFNRFSLLGPLMNLIMIPITAVITSLAFMIVLLAPISGIISKFIFLLLKIPFTLFFGLTDFINNSFHPTIYSSPPGIIILFLISCSFLLLCKSKNKYLQIISSLLILTCLILSSVQIGRYLPENLEFFSLDVGHGDSSIAVFNNGDGLLIDGGGMYGSNYQTGKNIVLPFILKQKVKLRYFAISHCHPDHLKGIIELIPILKPEEVWISSSAEDDPLYRLLLKTVSNYPDIKLLKVDSGFSRKIGDSTITCLHPESFLNRSKAMNNHSQVLRIESKRFSILLTGDIESDLEEILIKNKGLELKCDILKIPHHGSKSSSSNPFLSSTTPKIALISCPRKNYFGFPHPQVLLRLKKKNIKIYSTSVHGGIKISFIDGKGIIVKTSR